LNALRVEDWKIHFAIRHNWYGGGPAKPQNFPQVVNLREDPFAYQRRQLADVFPMGCDKLYAVVPAQAIVGQWLATFKEFPPSQESSTFGLDQVVKQLQAPKTSRLTQADSIRGARAHNIAAARQLLAAAAQPNQNADV
jgi:hypothetical protein